MTTKTKLTNNIIKIHKSESSPDNSDSDSETEQSSEVDVSEDYDDDEEEWSTDNDVEVCKSNNSNQENRNRRKIIIESDDEECGEENKKISKTKKYIKNKSKLEHSTDFDDGENETKEVKRKKCKNKSGSLSEGSTENSDDGSVDKNEIRDTNCKKNKNTSKQRKYSRTTQNKNIRLNTINRDKYKNRNYDNNSSSDDDEDYKPPIRKNNRSIESRYDKDKRDIKDISIILAAIDNELSEDDRLIIDSENDECNSEDEKTFMHETYKKNEYSAEDEQTNNKNKSCADIDKNKNNSNSDKSNKNTEPEIQEDVDAEYKSLIDLKTILIEKLKRNPKNKFVMKSLKKCKEEIVSLIKRSRIKNTTDYYNLVRNDSTITDEMTFFRKKLSNTQQKNIVKQLKDINDHIQIEKPHRLMLLETDIPIKYKATVMQKLNILESMDSSDQEYYKIKNWVDTFMRIPFMKYKNLSVNIDDGIDKCSEFIENSRNILDDCVYGMNDAKIQILQLLGQWVSNPSALGSAIGIYGPPGTAKTTIVKNGISKILGREFAFISLGGAGDSSFLDGHSYTYEGSSWGKIIQILIDSKCMNPVIYFDELDKVSDTPRGEEIINNLMHIIDTTQNSQFHDKYFSEVDFDISKCLFIFSYNDESKVNPILKDRMYRIKTSGYSCKDKITIARKHILPKIIEQVKFADGEIVIPDDVLEYIITENKYTQNEEGVRNLKRCLEIIHTKLNLYRLVKPGKNIFGKSMELIVEFPFTVTKNVVELLVKNESTQTQSFLSMYV
jgi:ATP-dependent Lon protease